MKNDNTIKLLKKIHEINDCCDNLERMEKICDTIYDMLDDYNRKKLLLYTAVYGIESVEIKINSEYKDAILQNKPLFRYTDKLNYTVELKDGYLRTENKERFKYSK